MTRTKSYTKAVSILHQLHNTLFATIDNLENFLDEKTHYFDAGDEKLNDQWSRYMDWISLEMGELRRWQRRLSQRMKRFDGMKVGLVSSSALHESRRSTKQGDDIGVLTNMTVAYLPFNLAAGIFSISTTTPPGLIWLYWIVTSVVLGIATFYFAFGRRIKRYWLQRDADRRK